ncbi:MAG: exopolyphosphatase, partial [Leptospirales bacterium]|nr:exopolyphosphatase [Leptospirales bacterium]
MPQKPIAAMDLGTNSFHLVVVQPDSQGRFEILSTEKEAVRLGSGGGDLDLILPDAMERGLVALKRFTAISRSMQAEIRAVATSAVREAKNSAEFLRQVKRECDLDVEVILGKEEARLIYLGILQCLPVYDKRVLTIDIGGGSTEYLIGKSGVPEFANSLKLGAIRLKDRFFEKGQVSERRIAECRQFIQIALTGVREEVL